MLKPSLTKVGSRAKLDMLKCICKLKHAEGDRLCFLQSVLCHPRLSQIQSTLCRAVKTTKVKSESNLRPGLAEMPCLMKPMPNKKINPNTIVSKSKTKPVSRRDSSPTSTRFQLYLTPDLLITPSPKHTKCQTNFFPLTFQHHSQNTLRTFSAHSSIGQEFFLNAFGKVFQSSMRYDCGAGGVSEEPQQRCPLTCLTCIQYIYIPWSCFQSLEVWSHEFWKPGTEVGNKKVIHQSGTINPISWVKQIDVR